MHLALDPTLKTLRSAYEGNAQLLLTHHPLIFKPLSRLEIGAFPGNVIFEAAKKGVSVVAVHTNLDAARGGINDILADLLGLKQVEVLEEVDEPEGVGLGRIGDLPQPAALSLVVESVKKIFGAHSLRVVGQDGAMIRRMAVVGGSGGTLISLASRKGAELLLTGDVSHHHALEAESMGMGLIDGGHFLTEKTAFRIFAERLEDVVKVKGWDVLVEVDEEERDPIEVKATNREPCLRPIGPTARREP